MSKVKINNEKYQELQNQINDAEICVQKAVQIWCDNFDNLYYAFIKNGFLDSLYEDSKGNYYDTIKGKTFAIRAGGAAVSTGLGAVGGAIAAGAAAGSAVPGPGTLIGALIGLVIGVGIAVFQYFNDPEDVPFYDGSKRVFEELLIRCVKNEDDSIIKVCNIDAKLRSSLVSLIEILSKINEFNKLYADLKASAQELELKTSVADDGITLLNVNTEVTINGEKVELSTSEAMNAFFTYTSTVFSAEVEAQYMEETYGLGIDYTELVKNANGFMVDSIESGLYTHEFVDHILPEYTTSRSSAISTLSEDLGTTVSETESIVNRSGGAFGNVGLYAGLIGATFVGSAISGINLSDDLGKKDISDGGSSGTTAGGTNPSGGNYNTNPSRADNTDAEKYVEPIPDENEDEEEIDPDGIGGYDGVIEEENEQDQIEEDYVPTFEGITETPLRNNGEITKPTENFDEKALMEYESQGAKTINEKRIQLVAEANELFDMSDHSLLKQKLQGYGYTESEIESIMADRNATINAIVNGETKKELAQISNRLATEANVTNYQSKYSQPSSLSQLYSDDSKKMLAVASSDENVMNAYQKYQDAEGRYQKIADEASELIKNTETTKTDLDRIKANIEQISSSDKSKWTPEQVEQYNNAVNAYNNAVEQANSKLDELDVIKTEYEAAQAEYDATRDYVLSQMIEEQKKSEEENNENVSTPSGAEVQLEHGNANQDNSFSLDELNQMINGR